MNYYDYRSYFQEITKDLDNIYSRQGQILTELQETRTELNKNFDNLNNTIKGYGILITAVILIATVFGVLSK